MAVRTDTSSISQGQYQTILNEIRKGHRQSDKIQQDLNQVKDDVSQLKTDVKQLKTDMTEVKSDVGDLKQDVSTIADYLEFERDQKGRVKTA